MSTRFISHEFCFTPLIKSGMMPDIMRCILENFIVIEGLDGSGTTTQLEKLANRIGEERCAVTFEPTDGAIGLLIRQVLRHEVTLTPQAIARLFSADRGEHIESPATGIRAIAGEGKLVICDRYLFSSLAYQSPDCGWDFVFSLNESFPLPEILLFLDVPPALCQKRMEVRNGKELYEDLSRQEAILHNYKRSFEAFSQTGMKLHVINGTVSPEEIHENMWNILSEHPSLLRY